MYFLKVVLVVRAASLVFLIPEAFFNLRSFSEGDSEELAMNNEERVNQPPKNFIYSLLLFFKLRRS
jgi:hypothetical protein